MLDLRSIHSFVPELNRLHACSLYSQLSWDHHRPRKLDGRASTLFYPMDSYSSQYRTHMSHLGVDTRLDSKQYSRTIQDQYILDKAGYKDDNYFHQGLEKRMKRIDIC